MYSLVSAPVLGFDLARLPGGPETARVLLRALLADEADLAVLASAYDESPARAAAWTAVGRTDPDVVSLRAVVRNARELSARGGPGSEVRLAATVSVLRGASIGTLDWLLGCIRDDVFDWTWQRAGSVRRQSEEAARAVAVVCDAAAASYLGGRLAEEPRRALSAAWVRAGRELPDREADLGPHAEVLEAFLARVRRTGPADLERLDGLTGTWRATGGDWARAVHDASWAVHLTGRVRAAAAAQLLLVEAVSAAGVPLGTLAGGTWNVLSGAAHALVVRDVLPGQVVHRLVGPCSGALGAFDRPFGLTL